jgi:hypothetical protein
MRPGDGVAELREMVGELLRFDDVNAHLVTLVSGLSVRYPMTAPGQAPDRPPHPLAGDRLAPAALEAEGVPDGAAAALRAGRGVLLDLTGGTGGLIGGLGGGELEGWADRVRPVTAGPAAGIAAAALLLRPDGRVAWARDAGSEDPEGLRAALRAWFGEPSAA